MQIKTKFDIGDIVYHYDSFNKPTWSTVKDIHIDTNSDTTKVSYTICTRYKDKQTVAETSLFTKEGIKEHFSDTVDKLPTPSNKSNNFHKSFDMVLQTTSAKDWVEWFINQEKHREERRTLKARELIKFLKSKKYFKPLHLWQI